MKKILTIVLAMFCGSLFAGAVYTYGDFGIIEHGREAEFWIRTHNSKTGEVAYWVLPVRFKKADENFNPYK